jgi:hypothetical protein
MLAYNVKIRHITAFDVSLQPHETYWSHVCNDVKHRRQHLRQPEQIYFLNKPRQPLVVKHLVSLLATRTNVHLFNKPNVE